MKSPNLNLDTIGLCSVAAILISAKWLMTPAPSVDQLMGFLGINAAQKEEVFHWEKELFSNVDCNLNLKIPLLFFNGI